MKNREGVKLINVVVFQQPGMYSGRLSEVRPCCHTLDSSTSGAHHEVIMMEDQCKQLLEQNNAVLFRQLRQHFDERTKEVTDWLSKHDERFDQVMSTLDHILKQLETTEQGRLMSHNQLDRHTGWIGQLAHATKTKLAPER